MKLHELNAPAGARKAVTRKGRGAGSGNGKTAGFGFSSLKFETEVGGMTLWLEELYLEPEYRGCGIGGSYFEFVKSEFGGKVKRIRLEVGPENVGAIRLYERNGFDFLNYRQMIIDY